MTVPNIFDALCPISEFKNLFLISVSFPPVRLSTKVNPDVYAPLMPSHPAATMPLIPPPFSSYAVFILLNFSFAVLTAADITFDTVSLTPLNTFDAACPIGVFKTASFISFTLFDTASFALLNAPVMTSLILLKTSLIFAQNSASFSLTLSQFLYKATPAAISPAISVTIRMIGHKFMTVLSAPCATVIAPVVVVAAVVAAACAVVAAVPAASAAVPAAVAAVFAVIFAMIEETPETNCCPVLIVEEMPCVTFPNPIANGPTAATTIPTLMIVCCCPSSSDLNHCVTSFIFDVNSPIAGAADDNNVFPISDIASLTLFIATFASSIGDFVLLYVVSTTLPYSDIEADKLVRSIRFSRIAVAISAAPFFPNNSVAICNASVSVFASLMLPIVSSRATSIDFPSAVAFCNAFFSPASACVVSTPFASNCAIKLIACGNERPISLNAALLSRT